MRYKQAVDLLKRARKDYISIATLSKQGVGINRPIQALGIVAHFVIETRVLVDYLHTLTISKEPYDESKRY